VALREDLEGVRGVGHDGEDARDVVVGHLVVEQVGHAVDEDAARPAPAQRQVELVRRSWTSKPFSK
jgi:hypothetical protein